MTKVLIVPVNGKIVKDVRGQVVPPEGRRYSYGPHWIRAKNKGLIEVKTEVEKVESALGEPAKGFYQRNTKGKK